MRIYHPSCRQYLKLLLLFSMLFSLFINGPVSAQTGPVLKKVAVRTPFNMPAILNPDFSGCASFPITDYGAVAGDKEKNAAAIAKAISLASVKGGNVIIPPGEWQCKKIHLKSNVNLHISEGATLVFSADPADYLPAVFTSWEGLECYNYSPLIYAFEVENVAITGKGEIRADMEYWRKWFPRPPQHMASIKRLYNWAQDGVPPAKRNMVNDSSNLRPHFIQFNRCSKVLLQDLKIRNSPFWTVHLYLCKDVVVRGLDIRAHGHNNDGIDPEMSQNILVENCVFDQGDDAIAIKSGRNPEGWHLKTPSRNIVIRNCLVKEGHQLVAIGSELSGGIENVLIENCQVAPENDKLMHLMFIKTNERMGGFVKNIIMRNVKAGKLHEGVLGIDTDVLYQWRSLVPTVTRRLTPIEGISLENISADSAKFLTRINGNEALPIQKVSLTGVSLKNAAEQRLQNKFINGFVVR